MFTTYIRIAEHLVEIQTGSAWVYGWIDRKFTHKAEPPLDGQTLDLSLVIEDGYGQPFVDFNVDIREEADAVVFDRPDYLIRFEYGFRRAHVSAYNSFALKHALMNLYSVFIVHHGWGLLVHSSCVEQDGRAWLFAGVSGAGKSTVARLSAPRPILSDEATVVKVEQGRVTVFDSPFRSELETPAVYGGFPLGGIQLLRQAVYNQRTPIRKADGVLQLLGKVFYWSYRKDETAKLFALCRELVNALPIFELHFQKNDTFWEEIS
jgi:hypothetical protein